MTKKHITKGAVRSMANRGSRNKSDFYQTPYSITQQFLDRVPNWNNPILEPARGKGAIVRVLKKNGYRVKSYDKETDFLKEPSRRKYDVITNPPFGLAFEFIQQAKRVSKNRFAMLLPLNYLHGKERWEQFYSKPTKFPLARVYIFIRYPMLSDTINKAGTYKTGMMVYAWFVWQRSRDKVKPKPTVHWINNDRFIESKKRKTVRR